MSKPNIEKLSQNITAGEKEAIKNLNGDTLKERVGSLDLKEAAEAMRRMNLNEAADKLESMTNADIINQISENPEIINKLKKLFK